jgi:hypothetical protein
VDDESEDEQDCEDNEENLRNSRRCRGNSTETEYGCDDCDQEEEDCPTQHQLPRLVVAETQCGERVCLEKVPKGEQKGPAAGRHNTLRGGSSPGRKNHEPGSR